MNNLKNENLLMVKNKELEEYFSSYFKNLYWVENNQKLLEYFYKKQSLVLFLSCHDPSISGVEVVKKIREESRESIIVLFTDDVKEEELLNILPFHVFTCIVKPFTESKLSKLLISLEKELKFINGNNDNIRLKEGYSFCKSRRTLYGKLKEEISLTKKEQALLRLLVDAHSEPVSTEIIEYTIWNEASMSSDCSNRLKVLLSGLRKKLPKGTIKNIHGVGYRITLSPSL